MKITNIAEFKGHHIETDEGEHYQYTRYAPDIWVVRMGESDEPVYDCEGMEALFQEKLRAR